MPSSPGEIENANISTKKPSHGVVTQKLVKEYSVGLTYILANTVTPQPAGHCRIQPISPVCKFHVLTRGWHSQPPGFAVLHSILESIFWQFSVTSSEAAVVTLKYKLDLICFEEFLQVC